jgi:hypothetical protein
MGDELNSCACGCGQPARRQYLPGHDAKHVAKVYKQVMKGQLGRRDATKQLPTKPLKDKLRNRLDRVS